MKLLVVVLVVVLVAVALLVLNKGLARRPRPPGTAGLDEDVAVRPDIDPAAVAAARARISAAVPDEVLSDALLDATPKQLARAFAAVPADVMAAAMGAQVATPQARGRPEDLAQLRKVGESVDDLEIWSFGDKS
jgi:hypothetical protein